MNVKPYVNNKTSAGNAILRVTMVTFFGSAILMVPVFIVSIVLRNVTLLTDAGFIAGGIMVLSLFGWVIGFARQGAEYNQDLPNRKIWVESNYPNLFTAEQVDELVRGETVYINDNGTTRDEVHEIYSEELRGQVLQFTTTSTPRLIPTGVA